jgi:LacI family transcriptional regulator
MATINDVARQADVSVATVSRVVNRPEIVNPVTRARVIAAITDLDYRPSQIARSLLLKRSNAVGVAINDFSSDYYGRMVQGVEDVFRQQGIATMVCSTAATLEGESRAIRFLTERQCDVLILHLDAMRDADIAVAPFGNTPVVFMNRFVGRQPDRSVFLDHREGGRLAARFLLGNGHRRIATLTGPLHYYEARQRLEGFKAELASAGLPLPDSHIVQGNFLESAGAAAAPQLLALRGEITAVFAHNDEMAAGFMAAARIHGVDVPDELSVLGFDDVDLARHVYPALTTIKQPLRAIGQAAGELGLALLRGHNPDGLQKMFAAEIVVRSTVRALP